MADSLAKAAGDLALVDSVAQDGRNESAIAHFSAAAPNTSALDAGEEGSNAIDIELQNEMSPKILEANDAGTKSNEKDISRANEGKLRSDFLRED